MSWGTIIVLAVVIAVAAAIIFKMVKDKRSGKSSCGGDCAHCGGCSACSSQNNTHISGKDA